MKIATSPGRRAECGQIRDAGALAEERLETAPAAETPFQESAEHLRQNPAAVRAAAERLRALVEKRGV